VSLHRSEPASTNPVRAADRAGDATAKPAREQVAIGKPAADGQTSVLGERSKQMERSTKVTTKSPNHADRMKVRQPWRRTPFRSRSVGDGSRLTSSVATTDGARKESPAPYRFDVWGSRSRMSGPPPLHSTWSRGSYRTDERQSRPTQRSAYWRRFAQPQRR
jgi:hypothetical protein